MSYTIPDKPANCPVCVRPTAGRVLVCADCWASVPRYDQIGFRRLYLANIKKPSAWQSKAAKIIRALNDKHEEGQTT